MENWLINGVLPSIVGGLIVLSIQAAARHLVSPPLEWGQLVRGSAVAAVIVLVVLTYWWPYSVVGTEWCLSPQGTTRVTGEVVRSVVRTPAVGVAIQIKLFPAGSGQALQKEEFGFTDWNGRFGVELGSPQPTRGMYLINAAYNYDSPLWDDRWYIKDFRKAQAPTCR